MRKKKFLFCVNKLHFLLGLKFSQVSVQRAGSLYDVTSCMAALSQFLPAEGVFVPGSMFLRAGGSPSKGVSVQAICPWGSLSRMVSFQGFFVQEGSLSVGVSVQQGLCPGGLCPAGLCPGGSLSRGSLSRGVSVQGGLCSGGVCRGVFVRGFSVPGVSDRYYLDRESPLW